MTYAFSRVVDRKVALQVSHWIFIALAFCGFLRRLLRLADGNTEREREVHVRRRGKGEGGGFVSYGFELGLCGSSGVLCVALTLLRSFGSLSHGIRNQSIVIVVVVVRVKSCRTLRWGIGGGG